MSSYPDQPDLPALISSRICHDLASPLMAISNGLELLELSGLPRTPEADLLADSVQAARARMEFFRIAYGAAGDGVDLASDKCAAALSGNFAERRITATWQVTGPVPRAQAKLAFLLAQCGEAAMPRGGTLAVTRDGDIWRLRGDTPAIKALPDLWAVLSGGGAPAEVGSAQVQFLLARAMATSLGRDIRVEAGDSHLILEAAPG